MCDGWVILLMILLASRFPVYSLFGSLLFWFDFNILPSEHLRLCEEGEAVLYEKGRMYWVGVRWVQTVGEMRSYERWCEFVRGNMTMKTSEFQTKYRTAKGESPYGWREKCAPSERPIRQMIAMKSVGEWSKPEQGDWQFRLYRCNMHAQIRERHDDRILSRVRPMQDASIHSLSLFLSLSFAPSLIPLSACVSFFLPVWYSPT